MKGLAFSAAMAADLAVVEDQGQGIGKKPDHGQHHQGCSLVDSGVFEVTVGGDGLKDFGISLGMVANRRRSGFPSGVLASITTTISTFLFTSIPAIL